MPSNMFHFRGLCLGVLLILLAVESAWTQGTRRTRGNTPNLGQFNLSGTLDRVDGASLVLTTTPGYTWILRPKPKVDISLTGKAIPAFLAPGQAVMFFAKLDLRHGTSLEEVRRLTVFVPNKKRPLGIQPDLGFGDLEKASLDGLHETKDLKRLDDKPQNKGADSPSPSDEMAKQGKHASKEAAPRDVESFIVLGTIQSVKNGELVVQVPNNTFLKQTRLTIAIAQNPSIFVELVGPPVLALVQPGDHVQASGDKVGEGMGEASSLRFRAERLLGSSAGAKSPKKKNDGGPSKRE